MNIVYKLLLSAALFVSIVSLSGCEGPEGPAGKDGTGVPGPKGDPGAPGTANVIYSDWKSVTTNMWTRSSGAGLVRFFHDFAAPPLDQTVLDKGMVLVYVKLTQDDNQIRPLPFTVASNLTQVRLEYALLDKKVRLWCTNPDQGSALTPPDGQYRYIIVPGGQAGRLSGRQLSYEEAVEMFGLPD